MKIALGTAQFGLDYGVANIQGKVVYKEVKSILEYSSCHGIDMLDTATAYGEIEQQLGDIGVGAWRVVTKIPPIPDDITDSAEWVRNLTQASLRKLQVPKLYGLLLHRPQDLLSPNGKTLYRELVGLKEQGMVDKIGVSIYGPEELDSLWPDFKFDLVQAPFNIIDRRIATSEWLPRLYQAGVEVHTRSVFLQGLLLMDDTSRPEFFNHWQSIWERWNRWLTEQALSPVQACLDFVLSQPEIARVVVGVDSLRQLQEILSRASATNIDTPASLVCTDENLINPSRWSLQ